MKRRVALFASCLLAAAVLLSGCRPTILYAGDPVQYDSLADPEAFSRGISRAGREEGYRVVFDWSEGEALEEIDAISLVRDVAPDLVVLSPYLSLLAAELAEVYPELPIIAFAAGPQRASPPTITRILISYEQGLREAGEFLAEWALSADDRSVVLVGAAGDENVLERRALETGFNEITGVPIPTVDVSMRPTRESVRAALQRIEATPETAVVVLLEGAAAGWALEFLQVEPVKLVLREAVRPNGPLDVLATVHPDSAAAVAAALSDPGLTVTADARLTVHQSNPQ